MTKQEIGICNRIKELRKCIGMTQTEFGEKIEVAQGYLTNIETAKRPATEKIIKIILLQTWNGKNVNEPWLRTGQGGNENMFKKDFPNDEYMAYATLIGNGANDRIKEAIIKYGRLSPDNKKIIDDAIELIVQMLKKEE